MRANNILGIIHSQAYDSTIKELTANRTIASVPFGCRYRLIDFPLSHMVNAGISTIGIMTQDHYHSLMDHVGSGKPWDLARKNDGMYLLPPYAENRFNEFSNTNARIASLYNNTNFIRRAKQEYVLMTDANSVYNFDLQELFDAHRASNADVTIVYKTGKLPKIDHNMVLTLDGDKITDISIANAESAGMEATYSFNIFLMRKSVLEYLIKTAASHDIGSFTKILQNNQSNLNIRGFAIPGYAEIIDDLHKYYEVSQDLLDPDICGSLFNTANPIQTKIRDNVPALYGTDCCVTESLIADGCRIEGTVKNSLLFRGVVVEEGAVVENCILMQDTVVHANCHLNSIITDKNVVITAGKSLHGDSSYPIYIAKRIVV